MRDAWSDVAKGKSQGVSYEVSYVGEDLVGLRIRIRDRVESSGVEVVGPMVEKKNKEGLWVVSVRVRSGVGIV